MTSTAGGSSIDPCGFSVYIGYIGTNTDGYAMLYSDFAMIYKLGAISLMYLFLNI